MLFIWISSVYPFEETTDREGRVVAWGAWRVGRTKKREFDKLLSKNCGSSKYTSYAFSRDSLFLTDL